MTMKVRKSLGVPVVALPVKGEDEQEAANGLCGCDARYEPVRNFVCEA